MIYQNLSKYMNIYTPIVFSIIVVEYNQNISVTLSLAFT